MDPDETVADSFAALRTYALVICHFSSERKYCVSCLRKHKLSSSHRFLSSVTQKEKEMSAAAAAAADKKKEKCVRTVLKEVGFNHPVSEMQMSCIAFSEQRSMAYIAYMNVGEGDDEEVGMLRIQRYALKDGGTFSHYGRVYRPSQDIIEEMAYTSIRMRVCDENGELFVSSCRGVLVLNADTFEVLRKIPLVGDKVSDLAAAAVAAACEIYVTEIGEIAISVKENRVFVLAHVHKWIGNVIDVDYDDLALLIIDHRTMRILHATSIRSNGRSINRYSLAVSDASGGSAGSGEVYVAYARIEDHRAVIASFDFDGRLLRSPTVVCDGTVYHCTELLLHPLKADALIMRTVTPTGYVLTQINRHTFEWRIMEYSEHCSSVMAFVYNPMVVVAASTAVPSLVYLVVVQDKSRRRAMVMGHHELITVPLPSSSSKKDESLPHLLKVEAERQWQQRRLVRKRKYRV